MLKFIIDLLLFSGVISVIIIVLTLLSEKMKKRISAGCRYLLWCIVVLRLCIPAGGMIMPKMISFPIDIARQTAEISKSVNEITIPDPVYYFNEYINEESSAVPDGIDSNETQVVTAKESEKTENSFTFGKKEIGYLITGIWLSGMIVFIVCNISGYIRNIKKLNSTLSAPGAKSLSVYKEVCRELNIRKAPPLYISRLAKTPMIYGFFRSRVLLPDIEMREEDISGVLRHELVHYRRKDLYVKLIAMLANAVHWFNPFVYFAAKKLMNEMELSCDERVLKNAGKEERISYGVAMLEIVKKCRRSAPPLTTGFNPRKNAVKQRFENILDTAKKKKGYPYAVIMLCVCILSTGLIGCETEKKTASKPEKVIPKEDIYDVIMEYEGDVTDIKPFYDIMDNSMDSYGVFLMTKSNQQFIIDRNGEIRCEIPKGVKGNYSFEYCSVCNMITDHTKYVDPESYEVKECVSGHGGGTGHYIYDLENDLICYTDVGGYRICDEVDFGIAAAVTPVNPDHTAEMTDNSYFGNTGSFVHTDDGMVFYRDPYISYDENYYNESGKYGIICDSKLVTDLDYDGYVNFDNYGICALKRDGKWGYYDHEGNMILDHLYGDAGIWAVGDHAQKVPYSSSGGLIALNKDGKWGYADTKGNIVIDFMFEKARPVSMGRAWVKDQGVWKLIEIKNINTELSSGEAAELLNSYFEDLYKDDSGFKWRFEYISQKEFYSIPCHSFKVYLDGEEGTGYAKEMLVTFDKTVYDNQVLDRYLEAVFEDEREELSE